jgi:hypothetical protein
LETVVGDDVILNESRLSPIFEFHCDVNEINHNRQTAAMTHQRLWSGLLFDEIVAAACRGNGGLAHLRHRSVIEVLLLFLLTSSMTDVYGSKPTGGASSNPNVTSTEETAGSGAADFQDFRGGRWKNYGKVVFISSAPVQRFGNS